MPVYVNANGVKKISSIFANVSGAKKEITSVWVNKNGAPVKIFDKSAGRYMYVLAGSSGLQYTYDFSTYYPCTLSPSVSSSGKLSNFAYGNGIIVVKYNNYVYYSNDGKTFTRASSNASESNYCLLFYINGKFIRTNSASAVYTSTDGITWTNTAATNAPANNKYNSMSQMFAYTENEIVVITAMNAVYRSSDGINWTITAMTNETGTASTLTTACSAFIYASGKYLVCARAPSNYASKGWENFNLLCSEDGVHFKPINLTGPSTGFSGIVYFEKTGKFYAADNISSATTTYMFESTDGYTWTRVTPVTSANFNAQYLFDAGDVLIAPVWQYKSADGINWVSTGSSNNFNEFVQIG